MISVYLYNPVRVCQSRAQVPCPLAVPFQVRCYSVQPSLVLLRKYFFCRLWTTVIHDNHLDGAWVLPNRVQLFLEHLRRSIVRNNQCYIHWIQYTTCIAIDTKDTMKAIPDNPPVIQYTNFSIFLNRVSQEYQRVSQCWFCFLSSSCNSLIRANNSVFISTTKSFAFLDSSNRTFSLSSVLIFSKDCFVTPPFGNPVPPLMTPS